jgi:3-oxoacyl-[acyl-carrier-protein] synthase-1
VILGTSTSGSAAGEAAFLYHETYGVFPPQYDYVQQEVGSASGFLAAYAGIKGIQYTLSTACSSSGKAFASAARLIAAGICDAVIVGGSDSLCALTIQGFATLESLSSSICNPFSVNRDGITLGEGAALFVMSVDPAEIELTGVGESSDGYHMTTPDPSGLGAKVAIMHALASVQCSAQEIGYINLHGTGTQKNDEMESQVIAELFKTKPYCSSTKPLIGHTLGAAAAQELALCWFLLSSEYNPQQRLPAQYWDGKVDPALAEINIINTETTWEIPRFMSNSFAFGGSNVSLIIEKNRG